MDHRVEPGGDEFCEASLLSKNSDAKNRAARTEVLFSTRCLLREPRLVRYSGNGYRIFATNGRRVL